MSEAGGALVLLPNLGGEEGADWAGQAARPPVATAAALWGSLFGAGASLDGRPASPHDAPAFDWLPDARAPDAGPAALAWLGDAAAAAHPAVAGRRWLGPAPAAVHRCHDKAFALSHGAAPPALRGLARCFEPRELEDAGSALAAIAETLGGWPAPLRARFCLKPRFGSSGRGRSLGSAASLDDATLRAALPRLARRGGAILEPWLARTLDLSLSVHVRDRDGTAGAPLELLGTLQCLTSPSGGPRGHRGEIDHRGRVHSGTRFDEALRGAGSELAAEAALCGYRGPCGVDAFAYRDTDGGEVLRPSVELNARFTLGIVALGCLRRVRTQLRRALEIEPGERAGVLVAPRAPGGDWNDFDVDLVLPIQTMRSVDPRRGPAILAARDPARLAGVAEAVSAAAADDREAAT